MDANIDHSYFLKRRKEVIEPFESIKKINNPKKKLENLSNKVNYVKLFSHLGVQGLVGLLENKKNKTPFVFKVGADVDKCIEHEYSVLEALNTIRPFCPSFVGSYGMYELPVCKEYIYEQARIYEDESYDASHSSNDSDASSMSEGSESASSSSDDDADDDKPLTLFSYNEDLAYNLKNVLLLEYVGNMSLRHVIKYADKNILYSQIICVLCGLYMAQRHINFTHYDLHTDNIMLKQIDDNSFFVYNLGSDAFIVPTYGIYPVIIDMGNSYCQQVEGESMKTSARWCKVGALSTFYDRFNDIHHFLLNLFYDIEKESEEYYFLSTRIMWLFRYLRVYRESGWKLLPADIFRDTRNFIKQLCPELYDMRGYREFDKMYIETLSLGIKLPWSDTFDPELIKEYKAANLDKCEFTDCTVFGIKTCFVEFFKSLEIIYKIDKGEDIIYILKEMVDLVYVHSKQITRNIDKVTTKKILNDLLKRIECCGVDIPLDINSVIPNVEKIDYGRMFYNCKMCFNLLSVMYHSRIAPNIESINDTYSKMEVRSAIDFIKLIKQNTSVRYDYNRHTVLYVWNSVQKTSKRVMLNSLMTNAEVEKLNELNPLRSELKILKLLKFK